VVGRDHAPSVYDASYAALVYIMLSVSVVKKNGYRKMAEKVSRKDKTKNKTSILRKLEIDARVTHGAFKTVLGDTSPATISSSTQSLARGYLNSHCVSKTVAQPVGIRSMYIALA
jgi:hypothetical protein